MHRRNSEQKSNYFRELALNLWHEGFTAKPEENCLLQVNLDGQPLCYVTDSGRVRYWEKDAAGDSRRKALGQVTDIARITDEYMRQTEVAPGLKADSLDGDYRLLAEFNDTVLAGHPTKYGVQFITWDRSFDGTSLNQGSYYGPGCGTDSYIAAKQSFAIRSGLIPDSALFSPEQLTEVYRSINETLENIELLTDERIKCLEASSKQIEQTVPDLEERVKRSLHAEEELDNRLLREQKGMQF